MTVKVTKKFKDIETGEIRSVGDIVEMTKKRYNTVLAAGPYVEKVEKSIKKESD